MGEFWLKTEVEQVGLMRSEATLLCYFRRNMVSEAVFVEVIILWSARPKIYNSSCP